MVSDECRVERTEKNMKKKITLLILSAMLLALSVRTEAQQPAGKVPRIGFLDSGSASDPGNILGVEAFRQGLRDLGYVEGKNINIDYRYDEGKPGRLQELAEELVRLKVDILLAMDSNCRPSGQEIDCNYSSRLHDRRQSDCSGLVASLARPGGNANGRHDQFPGIAWQASRTVEGSPSPRSPALAFSVMRTSTTAVQRSTENCEGFGC